MPSALSHLPRAQLLSAKDTAALFAALICAWFALIEGACAQSRDVATRLTESIQAAVAEEQLVGATWSLLTPEGVTTGAAGFNNALLRTPMRAGDRVQVGSVAKTLLATGVLQLVTAGRVELDAPLTTYLKQVRIDNPWEPVAPLRVRHLLDHTSGLDDARLWQVFSLRGDPDSPLLSAISRGEPTVTVRHRPGDRASYSNSGYLLLGLVIEAVSGERYESWLDRTLLQPLGMTQSTFAFVTQTGARADPTLAMGHFDPSTPASTIPIPVRPASQFTTTAADMARFAAFLMGDGRADGQQLVAPELLRAMAKPSTTEAARHGLRAGYALGLTRRDRHGAVGDCHLGNIGTFRSLFCIYRESNRALFVAFNSDPEGGRFDRIDQLLIQALGVSRAAAVPENSAGQEFAAWEGWYRLRPVRFQQFAYLDELGGVLRVRWADGALTLQSLGAAPRTLRPAGGALLRASERIEPSHVAFRSEGGQYAISDGLRTFERVSGWSVLGYAVGALAGAIGMIYVLVVGGLRCVRAHRERKLGSEPMLAASACVALLAITPLFYLGQPMLAIGDATAVNVAMALFSALLPFALIVAIVRGWPLRATRAWGALDLIALVAALQWYVVMALWGLVPLMLWR